MAALFIGVGSNIDPSRNVSAALDALERTFGPLQVSTIYRTAAVGFDGADFLNLVVATETDRPLASVTSALRAIEARHGRGGDSRGFTARTVDLDLLLYGDTVDAEHRVPRDEILKYAFVLRPLAELAAERRHPGTGRSIGEHWAEMAPEAPEMTPVTL